MKKLMRILVPVDGSSVSEEAVRLASTLAALSGAVLDVLHVSYFDSETDALEVSWLPESVTAPTGPVTQALFDRARELVDEGVTAEYHRCTGTPADVILSFAKDHDVDFIVMGSRRMDALHAALLGSVSKAVLDGAACPVTVVKEQSS